MTGITTPHRLPAPPALCRREISPYVPVIAFAIMEFSKKEKKIHPVYLKNKTDPLGNYCF
ncbi:MAG: hypothetical protein C4554_10770 [Dethiobacter sp.]|nr:MAG: hypothetical protein C4554_10770 [Dethiobacter sp.]